MVNHEAEQPVDGFRTLDFERNKEQMIQRAFDQARRQERGVDHNRFLGLKLSAMNAASGEHCDWNLEGTRHRESFIPVENCFLDSLAIAVEKPGGETQSSMGTEALLQGRKVFAIHPRSEPF